MLLNVPYSHDIGEIQRDLNHTLIEYLNRGFDPCITVTHDYKQKSLHLDSIVYLEKCQRITEIHMDDGKVYHSYVPIYQYEQMLPKTMFHRISSSAIVNWRYLEETIAYRAKVRCNGKLVELGMWPKDYKWVKAEHVRRSFNVLN